MSFLPLARELFLSRLAAEVGGAVPDPEAVARGAGIAFRYAAFPEDFDGVLIRDAGRFFIVCNDRVHPRGSPRSLFTFAHELGHYFIPEHRAALTAGESPVHFSRAEFNSQEVREQEADVFAANLLMPEAPFRAAVSPGVAGLDLVEELARRFTTSLTATAFRALALDLLPAPAAVMRWDALGRAVGRRLSADTIRLPPKFRELVTVPPEDSCAAAMVRGLCGGQRSGVLPAHRWFPRVTGYEPGDDIMIQEETRSLGSHGWLTLIFQRQ